MSQTVLWFAAAVLLGGGLLLAVWPGGRPRAADLLLAVSLCVPIGLGIGATGFFIWVVLLRLPPRWLLAVEIGGAALFVLGWWIRVAIGHRTDTRPQWVPWTPMDRVLAVAFLLVLGLGAYGFLCRSVRESHGLWDAWAIWNLKARFLYRGVDHWQDVVSDLIVWSHPDYPLLLPALIAQGWTFAGGESTAVPTGVAFLFTFATAGILVSAVWSLRGRTQGLLAGLVLLGTPFFVAHGATQYADIPVACFMLASLALLHRADTGTPPDRRLYCLAGILAGMAAWTKNEGLLFLLSLLTAQLGTTVIRGKGSQGWRRLAAFSGGALPLLLLVAAFKGLLAPATDLVAGQRLGVTVSRITDPSRYLQIVTAFAKQFLDRGKWNFFPVILPFYALLVGIHTARSGSANGGALSAGWRQSLAGTWGTVVLAIAGFFLAYLVTPRDLAWHLRTSVDRVFLQLWPSLLLATFLTIGSPSGASTDGPNAGEPSVASCGSPRIGPDVGYPGPGMA